ncbi:MAG TPA: L,D-transpeptidase [Anaerolineales bacterium]|nr:L,D-transpeptidase [Anaerolineales bacterium]
MSTRLTRREFLRLSSLFGGAAVLPPLLNRRRRLPDGEEIKQTTLKIVRVAIRQDDIYEFPSLEAPIIAHRQRDELVSVLEELVSEHGPPWNPRWYRVIGGYMHTAHVAPVETRFNEPLREIDPAGQLVRVTIPYTRTFRFLESTGWNPLYRLYYESNHWAIDVTEGPNGSPWYVLEDDLLHVEYMAPAAHFQPILPEEYAPIRPDNHNKKIVVSLAKQDLTCYEDGEIILHTSVSTGIPQLVPSHNGIPTETPRGVFNVSLKTPVRHMGDGQLTGDIFAYELPGVPWTTFFTETGVAFHGTYWHDNYGGRMSHGCVNMRTNEALWLYRWTTPVDKAEPGKWHINGFGTRIEVV